MFGLHYIMVTGFCSGLWTEGGMSFKILWHPPEDSLTHNRCAAWVAVISNSTPKTILPGCSSQYTQSI